MKMPSAIRRGRRILVRGITSLLGQLGVVALILAACASASNTSSSESVQNGDTSTQLGSPSRSTPVSSTKVDDSASRYDAGSFTGTDVWVDPVKGSDANDGSTREKALKNVDAAWLKVPKGGVLTTGYRLQLVAGSYPDTTAVRYWEDRHGTAQAPVIVQAADGPHTVKFASDMNVFNVDYFYVIGVDFIREGDAFHCEQCSYVLLRDAELSGGTGAHDLLKINQSSYVYIEDNDIHGADDNSIDFVAVEHGHVIGNKIHAAQDWCMYTKGGSAYLVVADNEVFDCGTGGITAGQGTGFEFMRSPWLNYEAYGIQIDNNVIHDTDGAGLGVAGGYDIVLAYNTLYRVGKRSHVAEFVHGRRGCDGNAQVCGANHDAGGWGSAASEDQFIPNKHIAFYDNVIVNPSDAPSQWQQFQIDGPLVPPSTSGVPSPSLADDDLRIVGNVVWNGTPDMALGTGDGCPDSNAVCNEAAIRSANAIDTIEPKLVDPEHGDYRLTAASRAALPHAVAIPALTWGGLPPELPVPAGETNVVISVDQTGLARAAGGPPGAL